MNPRIALFSSCLPGWSARDVIAVAQRCAFAAIEWGMGPGQAISDPASAAEAGARAADAGLPCAGIAMQDPEVSLATPDRALVGLELAVALAAPHVRVAAPRYRGGPLPRQQELSRHGLDTLVERALPGGVSVLVETSPGTLAPTPDLALALVDGHQPTAAGVLYDPGNMIIEGHVQAGLAVARLHEYLAHVHVKNIVWRRRGGAWQWQYSGLVAGMADWPAIIEALAAIGYRGRFSIDHLPGQATENRLRTEAVAFAHLIDDVLRRGDDRSPAPAPAPLPAARSHH
jgi:sugar phosphate isomerase/epimerase